MRFAPPVTVWNLSDDGGILSLASCRLFSYHPLMHVELPDAALAGTGMTPDHVRLEVAVALYRDRKVSMGRAAHLAGLPRIPFQRELADRGVTMDYDVAEYEEDLRVISEFVRP